MPSAGWRSAARPADAFARLDACGADPELVALCKRCLAADPEDRPRDAGEVAEAVAAHLAAAEERARQAELDRVRAEGEWAKARAQRKRRQAQIALAGALGLLILGGGAVAWWQDRQASGRRTADLKRQVAEERRVAEERDRVAYERLEMTGRLLLSPTIARMHVRGEQARALDDFQKLSEVHWPATLKGYSVRLIKPGLKEDDGLQVTSDDIPVLNGILNDPNKHEGTRLAPEEKAFFYYGALRAGATSAGCHTDPVRMGGPDRVAIGLMEGDLMAVVRIRLPTE